MLHAPVGELATPLYAREYQTTTELRNFHVIAAISYDDHNGAAHSSNRRLNRRRTPTLGVINGFGHYSDFQNGSRTIHMLYQLEEN